MDRTTSTNWERDLRAVDELLQKEQRHDSYHHTERTVPETLARILDHKRSLVASTIQNVRVFQEDVLTFLRAFTLMLETVASASTHGEKAARLRGLMELVESAANKVRKQQFRDDGTWSYGIREDVFRCDYPVRHWMEKVREAERRAEAAEEEARKVRETWAPKPSVGDDNGSADEPIREVPF